MTRRKAAEFKSDRCHPPSIFGIKNTSAPGFTGRRKSISYNSPSIATVVSYSSVSASPGNFRSISRMTPRRVFAATWNSVTPPV
jgi:hypothetical protein